MAANEIKDRLAIEAKKKQEKIAYENACKQILALGKFSKQWVDTALEMLDELRKTMTPGVLDGLRRFVCNPKSSITRKNLWMAVCYVRILELMHMDYKGNEEIANLKAAADNIISDLQKIDGRTLDIFAAKEFFFLALGRVSESVVAGLNDMKQNDVLDVLHRFKTLDFNAMTIRHGGSKLMTEYMNELGEHRDEIKYDDARLTLHKEVSSFLYHFVLYLRHLQRGNAEVVLDRKLKEINAILRHGGRNWYILLVCTGIGRYSNVKGESVLKKMVGEKADALEYGYKELNLNEGWLAVIVTKK